MDVYIKEEFKEDNKKPNGYIKEIDNNISLIHLSDKNLDNVVLSPKVPSNFLIDNGYEDNTTCRVCFTSSINGSLRGLSRKLKSVEVYVHEPIDNSKLKLIKPSKQAVPDADITGEIWCTNSVKLKCIGKIKIIDSYGDGHMYKYGPSNEYKAYLYDWEYEWTEKYSNSINESYKDDRGWIKCQFCDAIFDYDGNDNGTGVCPQCGRIHQETEYTKDLKDEDFIKDNRYPVHNKEFVKYFLDNIGRVAYSDICDEVLPVLFNKAKEYGLTKRIDSRSCAWKYRDSFPEVLKEETEIIKNGIFDKCIYCNFDKWKKSKNNNVLFITGLSGSGKTTYSREISKLYNATIISLDELFIDSNNTIINKVKDSDIYLDYIKSKHDKNRYDKLDKLFSYILNILYNDHNTLYIVEGIQLFDETFDSNMILNKPIIVKLTPLIVSLIRGSKRDKKSLSNIAQDIGKYISNKKLLDKFLNIIQNNNVSIIKEDNNIIDEEILKKSTHPLSDYLLGDENDEDLSKNNGKGKNICETETYDYFEEQELSTKERNNLPDEMFGLPEDRKYPLNDEEHILQAIRWFNKCDPKKMKELARNIRKAVIDCNMKVNLTKANKITKYLDYDEDDSKWFMVKEDTNTVNENEILSEEQYIIEVHEGEYITEEQIKDKSPIHVILMATNTIGAKIIRGYTKEPMSHAALSFDTKMDKIYSFDKRGLVCDSIDWLKNKLGNFKFQVYTVFINNSAVMKMKLKINDMMEHQKQYGYNYFGLIGVMLNRPYNPDKKMFCSQFVDDILRSGDLDATYKIRGLVKPMDFTTSKILVKTYDGNINDYNEREVKKKMKSIIQNPIEEDGELDWETYQDGFYHPDEIINLIQDDRGELMLTDSISIKEWFEYYKNRCNGAPYNADMEKAWFNKLQSANESEMVLLGWNPKLEFNSHNRKIASERLINEIKARKNNTIRENTEFNIDRATIDGGYYKNGKWHNIIVSEDGNILKKTIEMVIVNENGDIFTIQSDIGLFKLPMVSIQESDIDEDVIIKECESLGIKCNNISFKSNYSNTQYVNESGIEYDGCNISVYLIETDSKLDDVKGGKFHPYYAISCDLNTDERRVCLSKILDKPIVEAQTPIDFDKDGNFIININNNYQREFDKSHKLLLNYEKLDNYNGMKYEICKLWYINYKIEEALSSNPKDKKTLVDIRARVLNDFNKYIKIIMSQDNTFNLNEYIKDTPFNPDNIVISKNLIDKSISLFKKIIQR